MPETAPEGPNGPATAEAGLAWRAYRGRGVVFVGVDVWDAEDDARAFPRDYSDHYWVSNRGYRASRGCLGLPLAESKWAWDWAAIGTPVSIFV